MQDYPRVLIKERKTAMHGDCAVLDADPPAGRGGPALDVQLPHRWLQDVSPLSARRGLCTCFEGIFNAASKFFSLSVIGRQRKHRGKQRRWDRPESWNRRPGVPRQTPHALSAASCARRVHNHAGACRWQYLRPRTLTCDKRMTHGRFRACCRCAWSLHSPCAHSLLIDSGSIPHTALARISRW